MAITQKTAIIVPDEYARYVVQKPTAGNCLSVSTTGDYVGPITFKWGSEWTCFYKAYIRSIPNNAARLFDGEGIQTIMQTGSGYQITHQGVSQSGFTNQIIANEWHEYAITYRDGIVRAYRDVYRFNQIKHSTAVYGYTVVTYLFNRADGLRNCDMKVRDFKFYNRAFEDKEIVGHYFGRSYLDSYLYLYLKFDEGTGTTAHDSSGNGNDLSISGCSWSTY